MKLTWFGHSAFRVEFGNARIMIDPFLTGNPSFKGDPKEAAAGATHVLVTHGHNDHVGDAVAICKANGAMLVGSAEVGDWAEGQGVEKVNSGNHGGTVDCGGFTVSFVNALHSSSWTKPNGEGDLSRQSARARGEGAGRADALPHGRHRHFRRHGARSSRSISRRSASSRSATATRWAATRRRSPAGSTSSSAASSPATTAPFRSSTRPRTSSSARWGRMGAR